MKSILKNIDGLLIDLDGVVYISNQAIPGAAEAITRLKSKNIPIRFVTNTTTMSQDSLHKKMVSMGLPIAKHEIISAVQAAVIYLRNLSAVGRQNESAVGRPRPTARKTQPVVGRGRPTTHSSGRQTPSSAPPTVFLVLTEDTKKDFAEFKQTDKSPDYIVIGDLELGRPQLAVGMLDTKWRKVSPPDASPRSKQAVRSGDLTAHQNWNYELLNKIFNLLISGSKMIALHKGKFWQTDQGLTVDIGLFVAGLEYVTGQKATVIGKPSKTFFQMALKDLGVPASRAAMIGDDLDNDILGAQKAGIAKTILVKTGKYREELVKKSKVKADKVIDSIHKI